MGLQPDNKVKRKVKNIAVFGESDRFGVPLSAQDGRCEDFQ